MNKLFCLSFSAYHFRLSFQFAYHLPLSFLLLNPHWLACKRMSSLKLAMTVTVIGQPSIMLSYWM